MDLSNIFFTKIDRMMVRVTDQIKKLQEIKRITERDS